MRVCRPIAAGSGEDRVCDRVVALVPVEPVGVVFLDPCDLEVVESDVSEVTGGLVVDVAEVEVLAWALDAVDDEVRVGGSGDVRFEGEALTGAVAAAVIAGADGLEVRGPAVVEDRGRGVGPGDEPAGARVAFLAATLDAHPRCIPVCERTRSGTSSACP
jgi:hypothetical protein